jgi:TRAP-type mannitol/chloroaromatic compound transport system permease small subunit
MKLLLRFSDSVDELVEWIGSLTRFIVILTILVGFVNVVLRYVGRFVGQRLTSNVFIEMQWYMFSLTFFLGFAYILKHNLNVRVDFLYTNWDDKRRAWVNLLGTLIFLIPYCLIGIYATFDPVKFSWGWAPNKSLGDLSYMWLFFGCFVLMALYAGVIRIALQNNRWLRTIDGLVIVAFVGMFMLYSYPSDLLRQVAVETSPDPGGLLRAPIKGMIIVAWLLMLLQSLAQVIKYIDIISGHTAYHSVLIDETTAV